MASRSIVENEFVSLRYVEEDKLIHHQFKKHIFGPALHDVMESGRKALVQHRATKWLSDDRANPVLSPDDQEWANKVWFPETLKSGCWKYWAIVLPEKTVGQMNMRNLAAESGKRGLTVKLFSDPEVALTWLKSVT